MLKGSFRRETINYEAFAAWISCACEHPDMEFASAHVSNWGRVRLFQEALDRLGRDKFPTLLTEIPDTNSGSTGPEAAAEALRELKRFQEATDRWGRPVLVDDAGDVLHEYIAAYDGVFLFAGRSKLKAGVSVEGLFFVRNDAGELLFTSADFDQHVLEAPSRQSSGCARLVDGSSATSYTGPLVIQKPVPSDRGADTQFVYPSRLRVEVRDETSRDFDYIVGPLTRLFQAARAAGCRVYWT